MIELHKLPADAARYAIEHGEFSPQFLDLSPNIALIMTQDWCPDWLRMSSWLRRRSKNGEPESLAIAVYTLVYNQSPQFHEFLELKEQRFGNAQIPYVRYYRNAALIGQSNTVPYERFISYFDNATRP